MLKFLLAAAVMIGFGLSQAQASGLCQVSKTAKLAMDQRDDLRLRCLKQKKQQISVAQCLNIAANMEYSTNAEDARLICLYDLRTRPTLKECHNITKAMEFPDSGDEARWECLRHFNKTISKKQCNKLAQSMSYPANEQRALQYCDQELQ
nr:hypothetical protein BdHM001_28420 [Bdellovibrio sp. HM001]